MFLVFFIAKVEVQRAASGGTLCVGEELSNEGCLDLGCLGHPVASFLEQRGGPGTGCPFEDATEKAQPYTPRCAWFGQAPAGP